MIGKTFSHYEILEKLGEGGMGVVYKAHDTKLDRIVALKFLPSHLAAGDSDKARFRQEARAAAALNHPNVCVIYEIEESGEHPYIAMEFIEGVTLREKLTGGPLEVNTAIDYAIQIAEALQAAHAREIIHRDIKSDNIMITSDNRVKVTDFGLAKLRGAAKLTRTSSTMGTLAYMPPEHIRGGEVDARADIFSFGVVLYEMLAGRLPFQGEYESALMYAILNEEPEPLQRYRADISSELLHVVNRALEKIPDERYQSVSDMLIDLKRLKRDTDRISRDSAAYRAVVGKGGPSRKMVRSYWIRGAVAAAAIIVALVLFGRTFFKSTPTSSAFGENSVAVMYFENSSGEEDLGKILADMLTSNLSRCEQIDVVSSQHLFDILKRMGMADVEAIDRSVATDVAVNAGVGSMLLGSIYRVGGTLTANAQLCDVRTGKVLGAAQARGSRAEDVFEMVNSLTRDVISLMGVAREKGGEELRINDITTNSYEAYKHYQKGLEYVNRFAWGRAKEELEEAVRIDSTFAMAHCSLANVTAIFKIMAASDLTPERESIRLAKKYSGHATERERDFIESMDYFVHRDNERYVEKCREMAAAYPNNKYTYSGMAIGYFSLGNWRESLEAWEEVLTIDPEDGNALNMSAYCYAHLGEYEKAIQSIKNYIALMPDVKNTYDSACDIYLMAGRYDDAYRVCEEALRVNPEWTIFLQLQSYIHLFKGEYRHAIEMNRHIAETHPSLALYLGDDRGCFYMYLGRYDEAASEFRKVVEAARERRNANMEIGRLWAKEELYDIVERETEARLILSTFLGLAGDYRDAYRELEEVKKLSEEIFKEGYNTWPVKADYLIGVTAIREGDQDAVRAAANRIREYVETRQMDRILMDYYYMLRAGLHIDRGETGPAAAMLDSVSSLTQHHNPRCKAMAVELKALRGEQDKAIREYITLARDFSDAQFHFFDHFLLRSGANYRIARLYDKMGDREQAALYYRKALNQWEGADPDLPELIVTTQRLSELTD